MIKASILLKLHVSGVERTGLSMSIRERLCYLPPLFSFYSSIV
jgi:hypothetical protein